MWEKWRILDARLRRIENAVDHNSEAIKILLEPITKAEADKRNRIARAQEREREEHKQLMQKTFSRHLDKCPACGKDYFTAHAIELIYVCENYLDVYPGGGKPEIFCGNRKYNGKLDLEFYQEYFKGGRHLVLFHCQCGNEWVELPKDYNEAEK